jgi:myo-inositol-1(or 4)-monophosphatase
MKYKDLQKALEVTQNAAGKAGDLMTRNFRRSKIINEATRHDIKLELDVLCQKAIEKTLQREYPAFAILGEEGIQGDIQSEYRWVIDPIDGTVNFTHDVPHACTSIALQKRISNEAAIPDQNYQTILGVVLDPFTNEMWTAIRGRKARLNGRPISVSPRTKLGESMVTLGFAKKQSNIALMMPVFEALAHRVRKIRMMGAAALSMTYVASGRFDAYLESGVRLWDIAAGGLILECAGGDFGHRPIDSNHTYRLVVTNGHIGRAVRQYFPDDPA